MAKVHGKGGSITFAAAGGTTSYSAGFKSWELDDGIDTEDTTDFADGANNIHGFTTGLYNWTATENLAIGGHKFWNDNQNFTAGIDEALAVQSGGAAFVPKPKRTTSSFTANANSRAVCFAMVPS